ncbi:MAG: GIY-YIG nuclease family protein, partial [Alphaproteobacteria bacterium]
MGFRIFRRAGRLSAWTVYILKCRDGTLYTGITNNLKARLIRHESGTGAKYLRGRMPFEVVHAEIYETRSAVL